MGVSGEQLRAWAAAGLGNVTQEFPHDLRHRQIDDRTIPRPRELHPAFYGSFDWHSCVEMHWMLVRLLRTAPDAVASEEIRRTLRSLLTPQNLATEAAYLDQNPGWERPYGWCWALALADELAGWEDADAQLWAIALRPLAEVISRGLKQWLPKTEFPVRYGMHPNSAFALSRALPYAEHNDPQLLRAITERALAWFSNDVDYPAHYEPSGADFLSPALTEAELMSQLLDGSSYVQWLDRFLPRLADGRPAQLLTPVPVSDPADGQIAHLHGLNLSRAWAMRRIAAALPSNDSRIAVLLSAADRHADASLDAVTGSDYMVEHWLAAYAVLLLDGGVLVEILEEHRAHGGHGERAADVDHPPSEHRAREHNRG